MESLPRLRSLDSAAPPSVFLSYARADDEAFVGRLHAALVVAGLRVWWDRVSMPSRGLDFHQEIRDAIEAHDRLIVVIGEGAVASEYVRAEWQYALAADKAVTPVLRSGSHQLLPPELKSLHSADATRGRDEAKALEEIVRIAREPPAPIGRAFHVPAPPPHFRPRVDDFSRLAERFAIDQAQRIALGLERRVVALQGMGGLGKSVLAAALAKAASTRRQFPDGVIWLTCGREERSVLSQLQEAGLALGDDARKYTSATRAVEELRTRLESSAVLVVLDNVWWDEQAQPFRAALGRRCQLLITTRDAGLATRLGCSTVQLDLLPLEECLVLLADWIDSSAAALPAVASDVAHKCGRLPFALALAGAMVRGATPWQHLLEALTDADLGFITLQSPFAEYEYVDLLRMQQVSVDALRAANDPTVVAAAERYLEIASLRWERPVPEAVLTTLWSATAGLSEVRAARVLGILAEKALLRVEGDAPQRRVTLHDLQQDFLTAHVTDRAAAHGAVLDAYAARWPSAPFSVPDDGYFHDSLFHHLEHAGRFDAMDVLLAHEREDGRNAWWEARIALGQAFGYLSDVRRAWAQARSVAFAHVGAVAPEVIGRLVRYALIVGSIRDALTEIPAVLVPQLLAEGLWTSAQALAAARWHGSATARVEGLVAVIPFLVEADRQDIVDEALVLIRSFPEAGDRLRHLSALADVLDGPRRAQVQREAAADDVGASTREIGQPSADSPEGIGEGNRPDFTDGRYALERLARTAPVVELDGIVARARKLSACECSHVLSAVVGRLPASAQGEIAIEAATLATQCDADSAARIRAAAVRFLPQPQREEVATEVLGRVEALRMPRSRLGVLLDIVPMLAGPARIRAEKKISQDLELLNSADDVCALLEDGDRAAWLNQVEPSLLRAAIEPLIAAVLRSDNTYWRAKAIGALRAYLAPERLRGILSDEIRIAARIDDRGAHVECLGALCEVLDVQAREPIVERMLGMLAGTRTSLVPAWKLAKLLRLATPAQLDAVRGALLAAEDAAHFAAALAAAYAHHALWPRVYESLEQIGDAYSLSLALDDFPVPVPEHVAREIVLGVFETQDAELAAKAIPALAPSLPQQDRLNVARSALHALDYLEYPHDQGELLQALLPVLPCELLEDVATIVEDKASTLRDAIDVIRSRLAARYGRCGRIDDAIRALKPIQYMDHRVPAIVDIAEALTGEAREKLLETAESLAVHLWPPDQVALLVRMAQGASDGDRHRLLEKAASAASGISLEESSMLISPQEKKARALLAVAPHLEPGRRTALLLEAWRLAPKGGAFMGTDLRRKLSPHLALLPAEVLLEPWHADLDTASQSRRNVLGELDALPEVLARLGGTPAVLAIVTAVADVARWWPDSE